MNIAAADTETDPFLYDRIPEPFALGIKGNFGYYEFWGEPDSESGYCITKFIDWLIDLDDEYKNELIIYFHNGGRFDLHFFSEYFDENITVINGRIAEVTIYGVKFRDSYLLLPLPLSAHNKTEIDYSIMEREHRYATNNFLAIKQYLKDDCIYLYEWLEKFITRYDNPLTLPSAAFKQLKATGYKIINSSNRYDEMFRPYYYGGRTEVFEPGVHENKDIQYYDINSAYPYAMLSEHPYGNKYMTVEYLPDDTCYFAKILAVSRGCLPFRDEDAFLRFPSDNQPREYYATSWEINAGIETGTLDIIDVIECHIHEQTQNFSAFVNKFYEEKKAAKLAGDKDSETFAKLMLNSCYGKFALNSRLFKKFAVTPRSYLPSELVAMYKYYDVSNLDSLKEAIYFDADLKENDIARLENICTWEIVQNIDGKKGEIGFTIWQRDDPGNRYYNVATSASITGYVRAMMWKTIQQCSGVIYCDTDSIMCETFSGIESNELGEWSNECVFDNLYVGGKKLYAGHVKDMLYNIPEPEYKLVNGVRVAERVKTSDYWKTASKGSRLTHEQIIDIVKYNKIIKWENIAPSFSLRFGARFIDRNIKITV